MIGVAQNQARTGRADLVAGQTFHGSLRTDRHEDGDLDRAVSRQATQSQPRSGRRSAGVQNRNRWPSTLSESITTQLERHPFELGTDLVQAGHTKVFGLEQVVGCLTHQLADRIDPQSHHALASAVADKFKSEIGRSRIAC